MEKELFNLKFTVKQLQKFAERCKKAEASEKNKLKSAIQRQDPESARIHAENSIRQKNQATSFLRMAARIDAVAARVQTAVTTKSVTKSISSVVSAMESASKSMDLEKISKLMDKFEGEFDNLDVQSKIMDNTMANTVTLSTPEAAINSLMKEVADEAGLELNEQLNIPGMPASNTTPISTQEEDSLTQRLARLRQT